MVGSCILGGGFAVADSLLTGTAPEVRAEEGASVQQSITNAQAALRHRHYSQASRRLEDALTRFPGNVQLRLELGRVYVYQRQDSRAIEVFRTVLRDYPSGREIKFVLPRALTSDTNYTPAHTTLSA